MGFPGTRSFLPVLMSRLAAACLLAGSVSSCSTPERLSAVPAAQTALAQPAIGNARYLVGLDSGPLADEARQALRKEQAWLDSQGRQGPLPPAYYLAISGGADDGAFGAGLLTGWTAAGTRPDFKVVTGVSTGALAAPFAFLGPAYDPMLEKVYTTISARDVFKKRGMVRGVMADGMADSAPLRRMIDHYVDKKLLDAIAGEYAKGRLLLVGTADLDALEPVIWNMTAIAASQDPRAPELFRRVLVASASIPGLFPPVMIDVTVDGVRHQEMHVDGGTMAQIFLYPPSLTSGSGAAIAPRRRVLYLIRNSRTDADWTNVKRRTLPIASRAVSSLIRTQGIGDLYRIYATSRRDGLEYNLAVIPSSFKAARSGPFDTNYMRELYALGRDAGAKGYEWRNTPPGYDQDSAD